MLSQTHLEPPRVDTILEAHHNCVVLVGVVDLERVCHIARDEIHEIVG